MSQSRSFSRSLSLRSWPTVAALLCIQGTVLAQPAPGGGGGGAAGAAPSPWNTGQNAGPDTRPYALIATQRFRRDSNLFRAAESQGTETISTTGLGFQMNQLFSRQRLIADLAANRNTFNTNDRLNNTDYKGLLRWDMATSGELSGDTRLSFGQKLNGFGNAPVAGDTSKNLENNSQFSTRLQLGTYTLWSVEGGLAYRRLTFSNATAAGGELGATALNGGVRYNPTDLTSLGLGYRFTKGNYLNSNEGFDRNDLDFTARIAPNAVSAFTGRLSYTSQDYDTAARNDTKLMTAALGMQWRPGGALSFDFQALRDTNAGVGTGESSLETSTTNDVGVTNSLQGMMRLELTPKIAGNFTARLERRELERNITDPATNLTSPISGTDNTTFLGAGLDYNPIRWLKLQGNMGRENRKGLAPFSNDYNANIINLGAELKLD